MLNPRHTPYINTYNSLYSSDWQVGKYQRNETYSGTGYRSCPWIRRFVPNRVSSLSKFRIFTWWSGDGLARGRWIRHLPAGRSNGQRGHTRCMRAIQNISAIKKWRMQPSTSYTLQVWPEGDTDELHDPKYQYRQLALIFDLLQDAEAVPDILTKHLMLYRYVTFYPSEILTTPHDINCFTTGWIVGGLSFLVV